MGDDEIDSVVQAVLGRPLGLRILVGLEQGPLSVADVARRLSLEREEASRELTALLEAGLVEQLGDGSGAYRVRAQGWAALHAKLADIARRSNPRQ